MSASIAKLNLEQLATLRKELEQAKDWRVHVGVLGNKNARTGTGNTNAEIGLKHEFGSASENIPRRSFLRMPLYSQLPKKLETIAKSAWVAVILKKSMEQALKRLGVLAENAIQEAFATGGFGRWAPLSDYTLKMRHLKAMSKKGKSKGKFGTAILIETAQLRKSITSAVIK